MWVTGTIFPEELIEVARVIQFSPFALHIVCVCCYVGHYLIIHWIGMNL